MTDPEDIETVIDYPVEIDDYHRIEEAGGYEGDAFICDINAEEAGAPAHDHTNSWLVWTACPFCGGKIDTSAAYNENSEKVVKDVR